MFLNDIEKFSISNFKKIRIKKRRKYNIVQQKWENGSESAPIFSGTEASGRLKIIDLFTQWKKNYT